MYNQKKSLHEVSTILTYYNLDQEKDLTHGSFLYINKFL